MKRVRPLYYSFLAVALCLGGPAMAQHDDNEASQVTVQNTRDMQTMQVFADGERYFMLEEYAKALGSFEQARAMQPTNATVWYKIAECHARLNDFEKAELAARKAIELNKNNRYYYLLLAQLYESRQRYDDAAEVYEDLVKNIKNTDDYFYALANAYLQQNKHKESLRVMDRIEKSFGISEEVIRRKQQVYLRMNKLPEAIKEGQKLIDAYPDEPSFKIAQAQLLASNKRNEDAMMLLNQVISGGHEVGEARLLRGELLRQQGKTSEAVTEYRAAFTDPDVNIDQKVEVLVLLTQGLSEKMDTSLAQQLAVGMLTAHPHDAKAHALMGDIFNVTNKKAKARDSYLESVKYKANNYEVWKQIVRLDIELEQIDSLARHTAQAIELFPNQGAMWFYNGRANMMKKEYKTAIKSLEQARRLSAAQKEVLLEANAMLGDAYHHVKEYQKSDEAYDAALSLDSNNDYILNNYSYFLSLRRDKLEKAKSLSERLVSRHPNEASYLDTHGWVLYELKDYQNALRYLERAAKNSTNGTILEHYGDALYRMGEKEKAVHQWRLAKQYGGDTSDKLEKKLADGKLHE